MIARSSLLKHPSGVTLKTPLLVPAFSSRGFRFDRKGKKSEIKDIFRNTAEFITECLLVSAYDILYNYLPKPNKFPCTPLLTFVDSGGYETGVQHDFSSVYTYDHRQKKWTFNKLLQIVNNWPERLPAVFVSFDRDSAGKPVTRQIEDANKFFFRHPKQLHDFLLKPTRNCKGLLINTIRTVQPLIKELGTFNIIGVTEKELGHTMLDRMEAVAILRRSLDEAGIKAPIHVFGALDPLSSCLYLLAGAEIFDGLTWLRFGYSDGRCIYQHNYGVLNVSIDINNDQIRSKILSDNYYALRRLELAMRDFIDTKDFSKLQPHGALLKKANDSLLVKVGGV